MGYVHGLGESADTAAAQALHRAALAIIAARNAGNAAALSAAQASFNAIAGTNDQRVKALKAAETAPTGFLERLQGILTSSGKVAALGIAALLLGPYALKALGRSGQRPMRLNPGRRRRRHSRARRRGR